MNQFPYWNLFYIKSTMICILFTAAVQTQPSIQGVNTMNFTITSPNPVSAAWRHLVPGGKSHGGSCSRNSGNHGHFFQV